MKSKVGKFAILFLIIVIIVAAIILAVKMTKKEKGQDVIKEGNDTIIEQPKEIKKLKIVNEDSKTRPYAVMINNNHAAWPQCGVQDAYLVYEIIAEGGITRMMALYKDQDTSMDHLDGIALEGSVFFRDKTLNRAYEHTGFTSMENVKEYATKKGYTRDTNKDLLLNYSVDEIEMSNLDGAEKATQVDLKYSNYHTTSYEYDEENKVYKRSMSGKANVDLVTG